MEWCRWRSFVRSLARRCRARSSRWQRREGWRSLWLGTGAAYIKIFPQLAITYYVFEQVSEQMGVGGLARYDAGKRTGKIV